MSEQIQFSLTRADRRLAVTAAAPVIVAAARASHDRYRPPTIRTFLEKRPPEDERAREAGQVSLVLSTGLFRKIYGPARVKALSWLTGFYEELAKQSPDYGAEAPVNGKKFALTKYEADENEFLIRAFLKKPTASKERKVTIGQVTQVVQRCLGPIVNDLGIYDRNHDMAAAYDATKRQFSYSSERIRYGLTNETGISSASAANVLPDGYVMLEGHKVHRPEESLLYLAAGVAIAHADELPRGGVSGTIAESTN